MYQIRPLIRHVFRSLAILAAAAVVIIIACSAALPYLVEGRAVRESLMRNLSSWSGGQVAIRGPIRVASLIALTIEAHDVHLSKTERMFPVSRLDARSVKAIASITSLLQGRLEFRKVIIASPKFVLERQASRQAQTDPYGLDTINVAFALAGRSPFSDLILRQARFFAADGARKPYKAFFIPQIRLSKAAAGSRPQMAQGRKDNQELVPSDDSLGESPFALWIKGKQFEVAVRGEFDAEGDSVVGSAGLTLSPADPAAERIKNAMFPWEQGNGAALSGELAWSPGRLSLDNALMRFGDHNAKGSLALAVSPERRLLEGTLAYDVVDLTSIAGPADGKKHPYYLQPPDGLERELSKGLDLDMRISAERLRAGGFETGPFAVALTSKAGRLSADVAELGLFGGTVSGRVDYDPFVSPEISVSASGWRVDAASLSQALALPFPFLGPAAFNLNIVAPAGSLSTASGSFKISLPSGGSVDGNVSPRLKEALANHELAWGFGDTVSLSAAMIDGTIKDGGLTAAIDAEAANARLAGSFQVALPEGTLNGRLAIKDVNSGGNGVAIPARLSQDQDLNTLVISGTVATPSFSLAERPNLSN
jgi:AsmA protein